jgi:hypothetical protein
MGATLEQLYRDIENLKKKAAEVGRDLRPLLTEYVSVLGGAVSKQLVLSSFYLCTQVYPDAFLALSVSERESLQKNIQSLGDRLAGSLSEVQRPLQDLELEREVDPTMLLEQWETLETALAEVLREGTRQIDRQLLDHQIITVQSLDKLLSTADQAQEAGRTITNPPHLLKALVDPKELLEENLDPVVVIYLQIGDLEFTHAELMNLRQKMRPLQQKLIQIQQTYAKKQEEHLTAEAIAAWRASWTETRFLDGLTNE